MPVDDLYDTDSDDELPHGWEERATEDGWVYYASHLLKKTQWENPKSGKRKRVASELPYGWQRKVDEQNRIFYVDHLNHRTTYTDPRLAFAYDVEDKDRYSFRQRFDSSSTTDQVLEGRDLSGKVAIITGANSGIGYETARSLAHHGAQVILACRNIEKGNAAARDIRKNREDTKVRVMEIDLCSLQSVKRFALEFKTTGLPLHYLILNAGVFALPWQLTVDGIERTFAANHIGHFYLTKLLAQCLIESAPARVVVVSSESHRFVNKDDCINLNDLSPPQHQFWASTQYNRTKLCNILFSNELHRKLRSKGVACNSLHPGNMMFTSLPKSWWFYYLVFFMVRPFTKTMASSLSDTECWSLCIAMATDCGWHRANFCCKSYRTFLSHKTPRSMSYRKCSCSSCCCVIRITSLCEQG
ncbi:WW domain-containing oxidoreductase-like [Styela clava]